MMQVRGVAPGLQDSTRNIHSRFNRAASSTSSCLACNIMIQKSRFNRNAKCEIQSNREYFNIQLYFNIRNTIVSIQDSTFKIHSCLVFNIMMQHSINQDSIVHHPSKSNREYSIFTIQDSIVPRLQDPTCNNREYSGFNIQDSISNYS